MIKRELQELLDGSPMATLHRLVAGDNGASVELMATEMETGANGTVNEAAHTLLALAASHAVRPGWSVASFNLRGTDARANVGERVIATARVVREYEEVRWTALSRQLVGAFQAPTSTF